MDIDMDIEGERETDRWTGTDRDTERQTDCQTEKEREIPTETQKRAEPLLETLDTLISLRQGVSVVSHKTEQQLRRVRGFKPSTCYRNTEISSQHHSPDCGGQVLTSH